MMLLLYTFSCLFNLFAALSYYKYYNKQESMDIPDMILIFLPVLNTIGMLAMIYVTVKSILKK
jgi:hypothetical protein